MREVKIKFEDKKIVFQIEDESYFIGSDDFMKIIDSEQVRKVFHELKPEVLFADLNRIDTVAKLKILQDRNLPEKEIAEKLGIDTLRLKAWLEQRSGYIEAMKRDKDFKNLVARLVETRF